jgi:hypothetical protein
MINKNSKKKTVDNNKHKRENNLFKKQTIFCTGRKDYESLKPLFVPIFEWSNETSKKKLDKQTKKLSFVFSSR